MPTAPRAHRPPRPASRRLPRRDTRGPEHTRNYQHGWDKEDGLRAWYLKRHPTCEDCLAEGHVVGRGTTDRKEVDHVIPFVGLADPLRLDPENLRTRCRPHHAAKTARFDKQVREEYSLLAAQIGHDAAKRQVLAKWRDVMVGNRERTDVR